MPKMPAPWAEPPETEKSRFKPWLLVALPLVVLAFCTVLLTR